MNSFVEEFLVALDGMLADGEHCVFRCFGRQFASRAKVRVVTYDYFQFADWRGYYAKLPELDLGVVINPLVENEEFWWCKSEVKFIEAGAMGVPLVTSRVPPYLELIKEGETGFFASTPKEYAEKVVAVMRDEAMSRKVSAAMYAKVVEEYDIEKNTRKFLDDLVDVIGRSGKRMRSL
jgi:glycosyltransferase involved in cell wall biosynthesis